VCKEAVVWPVLLQLLQLRRVLREVYVLLR
jgi:hypothetical protein